MRVFLTGATGFLGRHLLDLLDESRAELVVCLVRDPAKLTGKSRATTYVKAVAGDLLQPEKYAAELAGVDVVCHLAALTGKATAEQMERVNVEGTRVLLETARAAGVKRFLHVSTISVTFPEKRHYPYARSKERAEEIVRSSDLDWAIIRPTIVLGPGSGWGKKLFALATAPIPFLFGSGRTRMQPVDVRDVAWFLAEMLGMPTLGRVTVEIGGPDVLTFDEFIAKVRARRTPILHVPAGPLVATLGALERPLFSLLPVTAGQFYGFLHDTTATPHTLAGRLMPARRNVDAMIEELRRA
jgi:NADH dehydrogenase